MLFVGVLPSRRGNKTSLEHFSAIVFFGLEMNTRQRSASSKNGNKVPDARRSTGIYRLILIILDSIPFPLQSSMTHIHVRRAIISTADR